MWKHVPNCITSLRIIGTLALLFFEPSDVTFLIIYTACGISDVVDGVIARATHTTSKLGTVLDSIADLLFYAVMLAKVFWTLISILDFWVWCIVLAVILIRVASYAVAAIKYKRFASQHTYLNKMSGFCMFLVPFMLVTPADKLYCIAVCMVTGVASLEELLIHAIQKDYIPEQKSIFHRRKKDRN